MDGVSLVAEAGRRRHGFSTAYATTIINCEFKFAMNVVA